MNRKHKTLLIGIKDYNPPGLGGPDLGGCVNDVVDMSGTLMACGFPLEAMRIIKNEEATKRNILENVSWLLSDNNPGDSLVFYYSGHGSYLIHDRPDHTRVKEQVIRPFESTKEITINELEQRFANLQTDIHLEVFMDCCHSGPADPVANFVKTNTHKLVPRFIPPTVDSSFQQDMKHRFALEERRLFQPRVVLSTKVDHVLWAACEIDRQANETMIGAEVRGIFTYHLCSVLRSTQGNIPRARLDSLVTEAISHSGFDQVPQLEVNAATMNNVIFT